MKTSVGCLLTVLLFLILHDAAAQGTAFTYQGRLMDNENPATGNYDLTFAVFDALVDGTQISVSLTNAPTTVSNGLFTVTLDFGEGLFTGEPRWLEIGVATNGGTGEFTLLNPRQALTPTPYAIHANTTSNVVPGSVVKSLNELRDDITLVAGSNVTITPSGNTLTIDSAGAGGSGIWNLNGADTYYNGGNVGIGTSTPANKLTIRTPTLGYGLEHTDGDIRLSTFVGRATGYLGTLSNHKLTFFANNNGFANMTMTLDTAGAVGIGTDSPTPGVRLEVNGTTRVVTGGSGGFISLGTPNGETGMAIIGTNRADLRFDGRIVRLVAGPLGGSPAFTRGIAINTNGNVRIGMTNFNNSTTLGIQGQPGDTFPLVMVAASGNLAFTVQADSLNFLTMYGDAAKTSGGTSWSTFSDRRLKENVKEYEPGLNEVLQLRPVRFRYLDDAKRGLTSAHEEVGFIAQEVREVIPEAVTEGKDGYLTLKADPIHWAAINAIQELNAKLAEQRTENAGLKQRLDAMEKLVHRLALAKESAR
jgi:hypothetical protein